MKKILFFSAFLWTNAVCAQENNYAFSLFGTLGYAITNQPYRYVHVDERGTLAQTSRIGGQLDAQFNPQWSATLQAELQPSTYKENRYHPRLSWAFLSYRPDNHWTLRLGKLRIPLLMNTENMSVGVSFVQQQLPIELYYASPVYDVTGLSLAYNYNAYWWENYLGYANGHQRIFFRGGFPENLQPNVAYFMPLQALVAGSTLTWQNLENDTRIRARLFYASARKRGSHSKVWAKEPSRFVEYAPGEFSYIPLAGFDGGKVSNRIRLLFLTFGMTWDLGDDYFLMAEAVKRLGLNVNNGMDSSALYVHLNKRLGKWTPYVSLAALFASNKTRHYLHQMAKPTGSAFLDNMNLSSADNLLASHQYSFALGTSFDLSHNQRIKAEWLYTKIGDSSAMVSAKNTQKYTHKAVQMFGVSYNFLFDF